MTGNCIARSATNSVQANSPSNCWLCFVDLEASLWLAIFLFE